MTALSEEKIRALIAADPGDAVRGELCRIQRELKQLLENMDLSVKWTVPASFHLTLVFLGSILSVNADEVCRTLEKTAQKFPKFRNSLSGLGFFKSTGTVWVGLAESQPLFELQAELVAALDMVPKSFHPHITLGRIKSKNRIGPHFFQTLENIKTVPICFDIQSLRLMKSELLPEGAKYMQLSCVPLAR
jgi:2'-5' RNA ligase